MKKWAMNMNFFTTVEFEVEAETYDEAVEKVYAQAVNFPIDAKELDYELEDYEELPDDYEFADGYYDNPDEEEEFEPGRPILDQMALNP